MVNFHRFGNGTVFSYLGKYEFRKVCIRFLKDSFFSSSWLFCKETGNNWAINLVRSHEKCQTIKID